MMRFAIDPGAGQPESGVLLAIYGLTDLLPDIA
jgi:hypothetical protein